MSADQCPNCQILHGKIIHLQSQVDTLKNQIDQLLRHRFGSRSERFEDSDDPRRALFPELIDESQHTDQAQEDPNNPSEGKKRSNKGKPQKRRIIYPNNLKVIETHISVDEQNIQYPCGKRIQVFDQEVTDRLAYQPESFYIDREICDKVACHCGKGIYSHSTRAYFATIISE